MQQYLLPPAFALLSFSSCGQLFLRHHVTPLLEQRIHIPIELGESLIDGLLSADSLLTVLVHFGRDLFPLGNLRCGNNAIELIAERTRVNVVGERSVLPRTASGR